jgi:hypothetical protein
MKRTIFIVLLILIAFGLSAQTRQRENSPPAPPEQVSISGNLELVNGRIALRSGGAVYYVFGVDRLVGFVDGFKEGAAVTLEGFAVPGSEDAEYRYLRAAKVSLNGKTYELPAPRHIARENGNGFRQDGPGRNGPGMGFGPRDRRMHHRGEWSDQRGRPRRGCW